MKTKEEDQNKIAFLKSLKTKIVLTFLVTSSIILVAIIIAVGVISNILMTKENNSKFIYLSEKNANEIDGWLSTQGQIVTEIVNSIEMQEILDKDQILQYLKKETQKNEYVTDIYLGYSDKSFIDGSGWTPDKGYDCTTRGWYTDTVEAGDLNYVSPYFDLVTDSMVMSIAKPVYIGGNLIGVIGMDVNLGTLNTIVQEAVAIDNSYAFLIDSNDNIIIHMDQEFMPSEDKQYNLSEIIEVTGDEITNNLVKDNELTALKDYDGAKRHYALANISSSGWAFGVAISDDAYTTSVKHFISLLLIAFLIAIVVVIFVSYLIGGRIAKPIIALSSGIQKQARLDFREMSNEDFIKFQKRKDEIGVITNSLLHMEENVRNLLLQTTHSVDQVVITADDLKDTSQQSSIAAQEVAQTIYEIAKGASEQAVNTQKSTENVMNIGHLIDEDKLNLDRLMDQYGHVEELVENGRSLINTLTQKSNENNEASNLVFQSILKMDEGSQKISEIANFISSIAQQTNLLSLNASIEAARAGEGGKGFAVVAAEIGKLAEQSTKSTNVINEIIQSLNEDVTLAVREMEKAAVILKEQTESVEQTEDNFNRISDTMKNAIGAIDILHQSSEQMQGSKEEILDAVQNLSAIAEENAASTQEASASMEESSAATEGIAASCDQLSKITEELQGLIQKFKV